MSIKSFQICRWFMVLTVFFVLLFNALYQFLFSQDTSSISATMQRRHMNALNSSLVTLNVQLRTMLNKDIANIRMNGAENGREHNQNFNGRTIDKFKPSSLKSEVQARVVVQSVTQNIAKPLSVLIFTMDSITSYEENSRAGGAAGE